MEMSISVPFGSRIVQMYIVKPSYRSSTAWFAPFCSGPCPPKETGREYLEILRRWVRAGEAPFERTRLIVRR